MSLENLNIGFAMCGSFCTISKCVDALKNLSETGCNIIPVMSRITYNTDNRFNEAESLRKQVEDICKREIIDSIPKAEPIGPKKLLDALIIAPCTGNTAAKIANGICDTPVTMAAKSTMRNMRPVLIAISTNDGLSNSAKNIGMLMNAKNIYFVPFGQDDCVKKPTSLVAKTEFIVPALECALKGIQYQPVLM